MIETVTPPLSICRLQWLNMLDIWDTNGNLNEFKYNKSFQELLLVLSEQKKLGFEGGYQVLTKLLAPQNFFSFPSVLGGNAYENLNYQNFSTAIKPSIPS